MILASNHFRNIPVAIAAKADDGIYTQKPSEKRFAKNFLESLKIVGFFLAYLHNFLSYKFSAFILTTKMVVFF